VAVRKISKARSSESSAIVQAPQPTLKITANRSEAAAGCGGGQNSQRGARERDVGFSPT